MGVHGGSSFALISATKVTCMRHQRSEAVKQAGRAAHVFGKRSPFRKRNMRSTIALLFGPRDRHPILLLGEGDRAALAPLAPAFGLHGHGGRPGLLDDQAWATRRCPAPVEIG